MKHGLLVTFVALALGCGERPREEFGTVARLADGTIIRGELIHIYDFSSSTHEPRDEQLYALFDPAGFSSNAEEDRSIGMVSSYDLESIETYPADPAVERYSDFLIDHGIVQLERGRWVELGIYSAEREARIEPFADVPLDVASWWT